MFRFFTIQGPWGRPDMTPYLFTSAVLEGRPIMVFNHGEMRRDFTYVTDLARAIRLLISAPPERPESPGRVPPGNDPWPVAPWLAVTIGNGISVLSLDFIAAIETAVGGAAIRLLLPIQPGNMAATWADSAPLPGLTGRAPQASIREGAAAYVSWFRDYYGDPRG